MEQLSDFLISIAVNLIFISSQLFWIRRLGATFGRFIRHAGWRRALAGVGVGLYLFLFAYNLPFPAHPEVERGSEATHLTVKAALLQAPFRWWFLSSVLGFALVVVFWIADRLARAVGRGYRLFAGA